MLHYEKVPIPIRNGVFLELGYKKYKIKIIKRFSYEKFKVFHAEIIRKPDL